MGASTPLDHQRLFDALVSIAMASKLSHLSTHIGSVLCLPFSNSPEHQAIVEANSRVMAKHITEADHRTLSYVKMLADSLFGDEFKPSIVVYPSYDKTGPNGYLTTLAASSITDSSIVWPEWAPFGPHRGSTREEALLGLLRSLEGWAAQKTRERNRVDFWENVYNGVVARGRERTERAAREAATGATNGEADGRGELRGI